MSFILPGRSLSLSGKTNIKIYRFIYFRVRLWVRRPVDELRGKYVCVLPKGEINLNRYIDERIDLEQ